jgi:predicted nuclease of predicted toxin-antitoxin system
LRFLVDAQLPPGLARHLSACGHPAIHVCEILPLEARDQAVALEANRRGTILVSKDEDFVDLSRRGILAVPLLWIRLGNATNERLWRSLEPLLPTIEAACALGEKIVEIR